MKINLTTAIEDFWIARTRGEFFPQAYFDRLTLDDAYRIQLALIDRLVAAGEHPIGWMVGLTVKVIHEQFGFHDPVFGSILETQPTGHMFGGTEMIHPGFETARCVRLGSRLEGDVTLEQVRNAVDVIHPSFEIIEKRSDLGKQVPVALADNAQQRSAVLGAPVQLEPATALDLVTARVQLNGQEVAGLGSAVLGNPLNSITWLAGKLGQYGRRLRPGDIVMTGSFVRQFPLGPGDIAVAVHATPGSSEDCVINPKWARMIISLSRMLLLMLPFIVGSGTMGFAQFDDLDALHRPIRELRNAGNYAEAILLAERYAETIEARFGVEHPEYAIALRTLARLFQDTNRLTEAESNLRRALAIDEKSIGPDHPEFAIDLNQLGVLLQNSKRFTEAEPLLRGALAIDEKSLGLDHPNVAADLFNLGLLLRDTNRLADAEPLLRRALAIEEKSFGSENPSVAIVLTNLAVLLRASNRNQEAQQLDRRVLMINEKSSRRRASPPSTVKKRAPAPPTEQKRPPARVSPPQEPEIPIVR